MHRRSHSRGFTLLELLVVVAIIGLLASIILASLDNARTAAANAVTAADMQQIAEVINDAEGESGETLYQIIDDNVTSDDPCNDGTDLRNSTGACYTAWVGYLADIQAVENTFPNVSQFDRDGWGSPFVIDVWPGTCSNAQYDRIVSPGPNGIYESFYVEQGGDDVVDMIPSC